jgi:integrase/recombinase XerD
MRYSTRSSRTTASPARSGSSRASMSLSEAIASFLLHHEAMNSQPKTLEWHTHCLGAFQRFCVERGITALAALTTEDLQRWIIHLQTSPGATGKRSARTVNWYVRSMRAFYRWCCRRGFVETDITTWLDLPKVEKPLIRIFENEEFSRLLAGCQADVKNRSTGPHHVARNEAILWVLLDTGIRLGELIKLKLADFDRSRGTIIVNGKGRKERKIALGKNALQALGRYLSRWRDMFPASQIVNTIFLTDKGSMTHKGVRLMLRRIQLRAGLGEWRVHPHLFRHTFAVRYLMNGGDIFTLQELLGHEDMETIRNYMHLADANVQVQKRKFSPGDQIQVVAKRLQRTGFRSAK